METNSEAENSAGSLRERLRSAVPVLFDGATGTELERRGHAASLPLWSSQALVDALDAIEDIHRDYVQAGTEVIAANTQRIWLAPASTCSSSRR